MHKKIIIVCSLLAILIATFFIIRFQNQIPAEVACTMDALVCPDGSSVGRVGPSCEFAACPPVADTPKEPVVLHSPKQGAIVSSSIVITGEALGTWFNEGQLMAYITDTAGEVIAETVVLAQGEWMTENYVPFAASIFFKLPAAKAGSDGKIIIKKENMS